MAENALILQNISCFRRKKQVFKLTTLKFFSHISYPGIFCGEARAENSARDVPVYYSDICKSELRRSDRRASMCIENLFFKVKKLQMKILLGKSQVALRKHKTKGQKITAGDLKKDGALELGYN